MSAFQDHFSGHAADYAAARPVYPARLAEVLGELVPACDAAVDVGCGNGQLTVRLGDVFAHVTGCDASAPQIENAQPHPHVTYHVAPAEALPLPDHSVDLVTVAQAAHWFAHEQFYAECRRVARPDALLAIISYDHMEITPEIATALREFDALVERHWPPERRFINTGGAALPFPFTPLPAPEVTMTVLWNLYGVLAYVNTWSAIKAAQREGIDLLRSLRELLLPVWGEPSRQREVRFPLTLKLARISH